MRSLSPKLLVIGLLAVCFTWTVRGQDEDPADIAANFADRPARPNLLEALGLTPDQIRQIRAMNRERKPVMEAAQQRLREANRTLDAAIYGDTLDESEVQARLAAFMQAQAEVARIRFQSEVQLRKILRPEQLTKFRMLRARMARARENLKQRRQRPPADRNMRGPLPPDRGRIN